MKDEDDENKQGTPIWGVPGSTWHIVVCVESHKLLGNTYPINKPHPNFSVTASAYHSVNLRISSMAYKIRHGHGIVERRSPTPYPTLEYPQQHHIYPTAMVDLPEALPDLDDTVSSIMTLDSDGASSDSFTPNFSTPNFLGPDFSAPVNPMLPLIRSSSPTSPTSSSKPPPKSVLTPIRLTSPDFISLLEESLNDGEGLKSPKVPNKVSRKRKRDTLEKDTFDEAVVVLRRSERLIKKARK
ncbi:hypothetical protein B0H65DRAFT_479142 [Neurospora tetraspora]|uniref:Uncharacterized protein n=1 Tax=Neurospora tetraspora TaxID=94610 RepID=A0AAE0J8H8_9PEZI|nr:hypothetical protein B0H65DRAFT_479142 [Neurospora tetraspora]